MHIRANICFRIFIKLLMTAAFTHGTGTESSFFFFFVLACSRESVTFWVSMCVCYETRKW